MERDLYRSGDFHGSSGPIPVGRYTRQTLLPVPEAFYQACLEVGFSADPDMNDEAMRCHDLTLTPAFSQGEREKGDLRGPSLSQRF